MCIEDDKEGLILLLQRLLSISPIVSGLVTIIGDGDIDGDIHIEVVGLLLSRVTCEISLSTEDTVFANIFQIRLA